ncbi:MAG: SpoIIIAH-like family protein [Lachnospiraceae bacterium]|nr:SpoIIIAH-like family protein [Lachnospiraceae bacterium]
MKNIFKKNQVIITSLALMIAVAGYLQMSGDAAKEKLPMEDATQVNSQVENHYEITAGDFTDYASDISDEDMMGQSLASAENDAAKTASAETDGVTDVANAAEVSEDPGEAVLVSTTIRGDFAVNAKLNREQTRARNKAVLMDMLGDDSLSETQKQEAIDVLLEMTAISEKEQAAELLLEAKGFADSVVNIVGEEVDVVINATEVTDRQIAQIEDIVMRKTGAEAEHIVIMAAVQED